MAQLRRGTTRFEPRVALHSHLYCGGEIGRKDEEAAIASASAGAKNTQVRDATELGSIAAQRNSLFFNLSDVMVAKYLSENISSSHVAIPTNSKFAVDI